MSEVFIIADNILSPLGTTTADNFRQLTQNVQGVQLRNEPGMSDQPFCASLFDKEQFTSSSHTKFEQLLIASVEDALRNSDIDPADKRTILIISSTKGNISLLETAECTPELKERISLHASAKIIKERFHFINEPLVVCNACISGSLAMITAMRMIRSGQYDHAVVTGADVISKFVLSGFQSFQAVSLQPCKPFDVARDGINLGEGAATVILSSQKKNGNDIKITGGSISNDANHISGPSRTGEELCQAMNAALKDAGLATADIDFVSAHGTATVYNDEMEAKALSLAGLEKVPVNSLKGYYGHTLGAAGLIESIVTAQCMKEDTILPTAGYHDMGVTQPVNISTSLQKASLQNCLKTASGFGGCNAALVLSKQ